MFLRAYLVKNVRQEERGLQVFVCNRKSILSLGSIEFLLGLFFRPIYIKIVYMYVFMCVNDPIQIFNFNNHLTRCVNVNRDDR